MSPAAKKGPDCYACAHRRTVPGSCHSACAHPDAQSGASVMDELASIFASVGRTLPPPLSDGAAKLNIVGNPHGYAHGWFSWPYNFDPVWLLNCDGFKAKGAKS